MRVLVNSAKRVCLSVAVILSSVPVAVQAEELRVATEGFYAPFNFIDSNGELAGFDIDIANALCAEMGATCEVVQNDWDALIPGLVENQYDVIIASMSITPEREAQVAFSLPYYSNALAFLGRRGSNIEISKEGLSGRKVGVQRSTVSSEYLEDTYGDQVEIQLFDTQEAALNTLADGGLDLVIGDNLPAYAWLQSEQGQAYEFVGEFVDIDDRIGIALRLDDQDLLDKINDALISIIGNGVYQEINAKYFPFSIYF
ncbi:MAG: transporter substrate-binding domain-containing protein [Pseudomonadota bacterium]